MMLKLPKFLTLCWLFLLWSLYSVNCSDINVKSLQDLPLRVHESEEKPFVFNFNVTQNNNSKHVFVRFRTLTSKIATIFQNDTFLLTDNVTVTVLGRLLGRTNMTIFVNTSDISQYVQGDNSNATSWYELPQKFRIVVSRKERSVDTIFTVVVIILVVVLNAAMGCKVDLTVVKETLKKPIAPVVGFLSQFILMPVISFMLGYFLKFDPGIALGFLATGCSPGGSASNIYTYLLGGDVSLSVTMTLVSTVASIGMIPLWLFTLGTRVLYKDAGIRIPYENIFISLLGLLIPIGFGLFLKYKKPAWAKKFVKIIRPVTGIFLIFVFTFGVYVNLYIFQVLSPLVILAGALLPYCGFIFGGVVALLTKQSKKNIVTIAIETGIQNTGIAIVLLRVSLEPPDNDLGIVPPVIAAVFTPVPLVLAIVAMEIRKRCCKDAIQTKENSREIHDEDNSHEMLSTSPDPDSPLKKPEIKTDTDQKVEMKGMNE